MALDSFGDNFGESVALGAVIGALGGALAGYAAGRDGRSLAIGAVAGSAIGAAGGYFAALQRQKQGQALVQQMMTDVEQANAQIDRTQLAFDQLVACRNGSAEWVRRDLAAGRIDRPEAERRMAVLRQQYAEDIAIGRRVAASIDARSADFEFANEQINPRPYFATAATTLWVPGSNPPVAMGTLVQGNAYRGSRIDEQWIKIHLDDGRIGVAAAQTLALHRQPVVTAAPPSTPRSSSSQRERTRPSPTRQAASPATPAASAPVAAGPATPVAVDHVVSTNLAKKSAFGLNVQEASQRTGGFELSSPG